MIIKVIVLIVKRSNNYGSIIVYLNINQSLKESFHAVGHQATSLLSTEYVSTIAPQHCWNNLAKPIVMRTKTRATAISSVCSTYSRTLVEHTEEIEAC